MTESTSTLNLRPPLWLPIVVVAIGGCFYLAGKNMEIQAPRENPLTISVSADAKVTTSPDIGYVTFGVVTGRQTTAKAATDLIAKNMKNVMTAITGLGIDAKDITTENFYLSPEYDYTPTGQVPRGFQASQSLRVKVRDLDKIGSVITTATEAGANQASNISFTVDKPEALQAQARTEAIEKAKAKALVLAQNLGMSLGRMTAFSEDGATPPMPMPMLQRAAMADDESAKIEISVPTGEQEIHSNVTLTYELR